MSECTGTIELEQDSQTSLWNFSFLTANANTALKKTTQDQCLIFESPSHFFNV